MSKGPLILWLVIELGRLCLTPAASQAVVRAFLGQPVTLPCTYSSWSPHSNSMCWGKGQCPNSKCNDELLYTDGTRVVSSKSPKYQLRGSIQTGDVSLTIINTNENDQSVYCCRIEVPGWFNDVKRNIRLDLRRAPTTTRLTTTRRAATTTSTTAAMTTTRRGPATTAATTAMTTTPRGPATTAATTAAAMTTAATATASAALPLPPAAATPSDPAPAAPRQVGTAAALPASGRPLTTLSLLPEEASTLLLPEPSPGGPALTAEPEPTLLPRTSQRSTEATSHRSTAFFTSKDLRKTVQRDLYIPPASPSAPETSFLVQNEVKPEQMRMTNNYELLMIIAPSLGFVLLALLLAFIFRGKFVKANCFQKHTRLDSVGEGKDVLSGTEDEDGLFTL